MAFDRLVGFDPTTKLPPGDVIDALTSAIADDLPIPVGTVTDGDGTGFRIWSHDGPGQPDGITDGDYVIRLEEEA